MKKLLRLFFWLFVIIILAAGSYLVYVFYFVKIKKLQSLNAVPQNSFLIVQTTDLWQAYDKITSSQIWQHLEHTKYLSDIQKDFEQVNKYLRSTPLPENFFENRSLIIALEPVRTKLEFAFIAELKDLGKLGKELKPILTQIPGYKTFKLRYAPDKWNVYTVYKLVYLKNQYQKIYICLTNNLLILSFNQKVMEQALQSLASQYWKKNAKFQKITSYLGSEELFRIYINFHELSDFVRTFQTQISPTVELFSNGLNYAALNFDLEDNLISLEGYVGVDSNALYLNIFSQLKPGILSSYSIMSEQSAAIFSLNFKNYADFYQKLMQEYQKSDSAGYNEITKDLNTLQKIFGININENIFSWIGDGIALYKLAPEGHEKAQDLVITIHTKDIDLARNELNTVMKKIKRITPFSFKTIDYKGYQINYLKISGFFNLFFGKYFKDLELPYYTFIDDFVVFSNSPIVLERVIDDYIMGLTLGNNAKFIDFFTEFEQKSNISTFVVIPNLFQTIYYYAPQDTRRSLVQNKDALTGFSFAGLQIINKNDKFKILLKAQYDPSVKIDLKIQKLERQNEIQELTSLIDSAKFKISLPDSLINMEGEVKIKFSDTNLIQYEGKIQNHHPAQLWRVYYRDGNLKMTQLFDNNGNLNGTVQFFYDNKANAKLADIPTSNGQVNGTVIIYYPDGQKKAAIEYKNSLKNGRAIYYYKNGKIQIIGHFKNGKKHGRWLYYDSQGNLLAKEHWKNGKRKR